MNEWRLFSVLGCGLEIRFRCFFGGQDSLFELITNTSFLAYLRRFV